MKPEFRKMVVATLAEFEAQLSDRDEIMRGDKLLGIRVATKGKRLRFESTRTENCMASGLIEADSVRRFVVTFWYWKPTSGPGWSRAQIPAPVVNTCKGEAPNPLLVALGYTGPVCRPDETDAAFKARVLAGLK